jgi:hypothetical protein
MKFGKLTLLTTVAFLGALPIPVLRNYQLRCSRRGHDGKFKTGDRS